jgi:hypothetical protein
MTDTLVGRQPTDYQELAKRVGPIPSSTVPPASWSGPGSSANPTPANPVDSAGQAAG